MMNREKITIKEKELLQNKTNQENLAAAMVMLENINRNYYGEHNRNTKSRMNELLILLKDKEQKFSLSVRAANALSILDGMTQDKMMKGARNRRHITIEYIKSNSSCHPSGSSTNSRSICNNNDNIIISICLSREEERGTRQWQQK